MSEKDEARGEKLVDMVLNTRTLEQIKEVVGSEEYKKASGVEIALAAPMLGFTMLKLRLEHIEEELRELREKVDTIGGKK